MTKSDQTKKLRRCKNSLALSTASIALYQRPHRRAIRYSGFILFLVSQSLFAQIPSTSQLKSESITPQAQTIRTMDQVLQRRGTVTFRDTPIAEVILTDRKSVV